MNNFYKLSHLKKILFVLFFSISFNTYAQTFIIGNGTYVNDSVSYPCPYGKYSVDGRQQYLYQQSELYSLGMLPGLINQIGFNIPTSLNGAGVVQNFTIKISNASANNLSGGWESGLTTVFGPVDYSPAIGWNLHATSGFSWDGVSNLVVEVCWTDTNSNSSYNPSVQFSVVASAARSYFSNTDSDACNTSTGSVLYDNRPNILFVQNGTPFILTETHINSTCGNANGSIDLTVASGMAVSYNWSNGATTEDLSNLTSGVYTVTAVDTQGYSSSLTVTVSNSNGPVISETHQNNTCASANGSIDITVTGGTPPYTYSWSNGETTEDVSSLLNGNYTVTVTDLTNCNNFITVTLIDASLYYYVYVSPSYPNCTNNGTLTAIPYNGFSPFNYLWSNGQTTQTITGLSAGLYDVTVTDSVGCVRTVNNYNLTTVCYNVAEGYVYDDANGNCIYDAGETPVVNEIAEATDGTNVFYGYSDASGHYSINISFAGTYLLTIYSGNYGNCSNTPCSMASITFPSVGDTSFNNNEGLHFGTDHNLAIYPNCFGTNPGFEKEYYIESWDMNYPAYTDTVTVVFNYDPNLIFDSCLSIQPVVDTLNHTLTWKVDTVNYNGHFDTYFHVPASLPLTYLIQSDFSISPFVDDCDTTNNHLHFAEVVTSSNDPNEKTVTPAGNITAADSVLTYTIHFQNTGTDTTHFVILKDTLSQYLNPATVVNLAASAPYSDFNISGTGILTWVFNPLFLTDSASNNAASKGFVMFKIKVKPNLPVGTVINNNASIYFDYNAPVVTNTATNSIISGIKEIASASDISIYPNPANDELTMQLLNGVSAKNFTVTDVFGRLIYSQQINLKSAIINLQSFSQGIYFLKVQLQNGDVFVKRFVKE